MIQVDVQWQEFTSRLTKNDIEVKQHKYNNEKEMDNINALDGYNSHRWALCR
jgi:hypothetical protein